MNIDTELQDYEAAGSLAEELPYWGWLDDERSCLTRAGELMSLARVSPSVLDGQTPEQLDRVIERWQRMLSGLDARTRFYFYLLRRPLHFPEVPPRRRFQGGDTRPAKAPGISHQSGCRTCRLMLHGLTIRAYPPWHPGGPGGRGGWPTRRTGWRGGGTRRGPCTSFPPSKRRARRFARQSMQAGRWSMTSRRYACSKPMKPQKF